MPAWSTDIAAFMLAASKRRGIALNQMRLQRLVYIAHGLRLANCGEALTGDRPEAWDYGPVYRRLADATAPYGDTLVGDLFGVSADWSGLDQSERDLMRFVVQRVGTLPLERLSAVTRGEGSPWQLVYAAGDGRYRDIAHRLVKEQFDSLEEDWAEAHACPPFRE